MFDDVKLPVISEFPVQHEPDAELGVPTPVTHEQAKASEGNLLLSTNCPTVDHGCATGFCIVPAVEYFDGLAKCQAFFDRAKGTAELYCEYDTFFSTMEQVHLAVKAQEITATEEAVIRKLWPKGEFGFPVRPWDYFNEE